MILRSEYSKVVYERPWLKFIRKSGSVYLLDAPKGEQRLDAARIEVLVANPDALLVYNAALGGLEVQVSGNVLFALGEREWRSAGRVDLAIDDIRNDIASFVTTIPAAVNNLQASGALETYQA